MTAAELHEAAQNSFPSPNFLYLKEVRDATGFDAVRTADAIAIGMYRSCGRLIHGFEMKVSRSDWLRELKDASKAESLMRFCHRWAVIVPDAAIVHDGELPPAWGLGVPHRTRSNANLKIKWIVPPPELSPEVLSMVCLTALLAAATKPDKKAWEAALAEQFKAGHAAGERSQSGSPEQHERLVAAVEAFERESGVSLNTYMSAERAAEWGVEFKAWRNARGSVDGFLRRMRFAEVEAKRAVAGLSETIAKLGVADV